MEYKRLSNEELSKFPYPNLIAELIESHYSICTLGDHMGLGRYRREDDPEIWAKLRGQQKITASESVGLSRLFGAKLEYLFSDTLNILCEKPMAYIRWYDTNKRHEIETQQIRDRDKIMGILREFPALIPKVLNFLEEEKANVG